MHAHVHAPDKFENAYSREGPSHARTLTNLVTSVPKSSSSFWAVVLPVCSWCCWMNPCSASTSSGVSTFSRATMPMLHFAGNSPWVGHEWKESPWVSFVSIHDVVRFAFGAQKGSVERKEHTCKRQGTKPAKRTKNNHHANY